MKWGEFSLERSDYKNNDKVFSLVDKSSGQTLEIAAKIKSTEQTDLEITFYVSHCLINNTDQLLGFQSDKKSKLPCQIGNIIPVNGSI